MPGGGAEGAVEVYVPERLVSSRAKTVLGPLVRLQHPRAALMMAFVVPKPGRWRVEPHIIWAPPGREPPPDGVWQVTGHVALVKYKGLRELAVEGLRLGLYPYFHLAPWGAPLLYAVDYREGDPEEVRAVKALGAPRVLEWLRKVRGRVRIVEV